MTYRGYSIEKATSGNFSVYGNSMYACWDGFKTVEAAKAFIEKRLAA